MLETDVLETQSGGEALPEVQATEAPPVDRRAAIEAAFNKPDESAEQRARDERGRFAVEQREANEAKDEAKAAAIEARKYPSSWKPDVKPLYERIASDPELKAIADEIDRRESDFHKGIENYKSKAQFADAMQQAIAPFEATIRAYGVSPDVAVQHLLAADHRLRYGAPHEKAQLFQQLARDYGVDLQSLPEQASVDPNFAALQQELQSLKQQQYQYFLSQQQAAQSQIMQDIERFSADKPHFEAVREDMAALLQAGRAESLEQAYEMAVWARPDIRSGLLEQQLKEQEEAKRKEAAQRAAAAKAAAVQVRGAPTGGPTSPPTSDRRAQIAAAFDRSRI